jgi:biopolymer transport protein TolQ
MKANFIQAVFQSGAVCQGILLSLFLLSIVSWAIIAYKLKLFHRIYRESEEFLKSFRGIEWFSDGEGAFIQFNQSPLCNVFRAGYNEFRVRREEGTRASGSPKVAEANDNNEQKITSPGIDAVKRALQRATSTEILQLEKGLFFLATMATGCPFIGLFGTVWGVMDSFMSMQTYRSASISAVGPGIAGALTTTIVGLAAAIPALVAYNYFVNRVDTITSEMENFSSEFISLLERRFAEK